jgi:predicted MPP superfamily phosphohydrolase
MITRRGVLGSLLGLAGASVSTAAYGFWVEPGWRLALAEYRLTPPRWPHGLKMRVALIADLHAGEPFMPVERIDHIVARTNALKPDLVLLLGDYLADHRFVTREARPEQTLACLAALTAPLGVYGILGNHDYWYDRATRFRAAFTTVEIPLLENDVARVATPAGPIFLAGTASMLAGHPDNPARSLDDVPATLAKVPFGAPVLLAVHEPDQFVGVPGRVSLTVAGHTHGGQVRLFGWSPLVPSHYGNRFAYGHIEEGGRHLVVSGGLGVSTLPVRFGVPPEITLLTLG